MGWVDVQAFLRAEAGTLRTGEHTTITGAIAGRRTDLGPASAVLYDNQMGCTFISPNNEGGWSCASCLLGGSCTPHCVAEGSHCDFTIALCGQDNGAVACSVGPTHGNCGADGICWDVVPLGGPCEADGQCEAIACNLTAPCGACSPAGCCGKDGALCHDESDCCDSGHPFGMTCNKKGGATGMCVPKVVGNCKTSADCLGANSLCVNGACQVDATYCVQTPGGAAPGGGCVGNCECAIGYCEPPSGAGTCASALPCATDNDCVGAATCVAGACVAAAGPCGGALGSGALGSTCNAGCECASSNCAKPILGTCKGIAGSVCNTATDCAAGLSCTCNICGAPIVPLGEACEQDCECFGSKCVDHVCSQPPPVVSSAIPLVNAVGTDRVCHLSRSPFLLASSLSASELCAYDEDGNGLDDGIEAEIAACFMPQFRFTAGEAALENGEPKVLYNMYRIASGPQPYPRIKVNLEVLWRNDGGYDSEGLLCGFGGYDKHTGDNQSITLEVDVAANRYSWFAALRQVTAAPEPVVQEQTLTAASHNDTNIEVVVDANGSHPIIYSSRGKHHWSWHPYLVNDDCGLTPVQLTAAQTAIDALAALCVIGLAEAGPISVGGAVISLSCVDVAACAIPYVCFARYDVSAGDGAQIIPTQVAHAPLFFGNAVTAPAGSGATTSGNAWWNACSVTRASQTSPGAPVGAVHLAHPTLADLGYNNGFFEPFTGGQGNASPDSSTLADNLQAAADFLHDPDGDGVSNVDVSVPTKSHANQDVCPLSGLIKIDPTATPTVDGTADVDGDSIIDSCDSDLLHQQYFVAGHPQPTQVGGAPALPPWFEPRGGFRDTDGDLAIDGEDTCPGVPVGAQLEAGANLWGETLSYDAKFGDFKPGFAPYELGHFFRGDVCDPYPVAPIKFPGASFGQQDCSPLAPGKNTVTLGASPVPLEVRMVEGRSGNDPNGNVGSTVGRQVEVYHCACTTPQCISAQGSACRLNDVPPSQSTNTNPGVGWYPGQLAGCTLAGTGECDSVLLPFVTRQVTNTSVSWDWNSERTSFPDHFGPSAFYGVAKASGGAGYISAHPHAIWTLSRVPSPPGAALSGLVNPYPEPELLDDDAHFAGGNSLQHLDGRHSRRLRTGFAPFTAKVSDAHLVPSAGECAVIPAIADECTATSCGATIMIAHWPLGGPSGSTAIGSATDVGGVLLPSSGLLSGAVVFLASRGNYRAVELAANVPQWARVAGGGVAVLAPQVRSARSVAITDFADSIPPADPDLLWVQRSESARWVKLRAVRRTDRSVGYEAVASGLVGASTLAYTLVTDELGASAALVDLAGGRALGFDPSGGAWYPSFASFDAVKGRTEASMTVGGRFLYVAGGRKGGAAQTSAHALDLFGREAIPLATNLPVRRNARLSVGLGGHALLLGGGTDALGVAHDDVWTLPLTGASLASARLARADTADAASYQPPRTFLLGSDDARDLRAVAIDTSRPALTDSRARGETAWTAVAATGQPLPTSICSSSTGGASCSVSSAWWASVGARACDAPHACRGTPGVLQGELAVATSEPRAISVDGSFLWVATSMGIERWALSATTPELRGVRSLSGIRDVSAMHGAALLATDQGVRLASATQTGIDLTEPLAVCGRPIAAAALAPRRWLVLSTLALNVVEQSSAGLSLVSAIPLAADGDDGFTGAGIDAPSLAQCAQADQHLPPGLVSKVRNRTHMTSAGVDRVLVARGSALFDVRTHDGRGVFVKSRLELGDTISAARVDGARAYVVAGDERPVVSLASNALLLAGSHDVASWVTRQDGDGFAVRIDGDHVRLARVVR